MALHGRMQDSATQLAFHLPLVEQALVLDAIRDGPVLKVAGAHLCGNQGRDRVCHFASSMWWVENNSLDERRQKR